MQICDIAIEGFRSLINVPSVPIKGQTIITGQNDGGKSALLDALEFLISGKEPSEHDMSYLTVMDNADSGQEPALRVSQIVVTGTFQLSESEREEFSLPELVKIRRRFTSDGVCALEVKRAVCVHEDLRNLETEKVAILKEIAAKYEVEPVGRTNMRDSWSVPLSQLANRLPTVDEWVPLPNDTAASLPTIVYFKGDAVQAPEVIVLNILNSKLKDYSKGETSRKKIGELEDHLAESLVADIDRIRDHVTKRCGFSSVKLDPQVQVRPSLIRVEMRVANAAGHEVPLSAAGTGRSRRISLALWESSNEVLGSRLSAEGDDAYGGAADVVFVYDEPDTHLDYEHQRRVMNLIHEQSKLPNARVVVATHSLNLIDGVDIANVVHLRVAKSGTYAELLSEDSDDEGVRKHLSTIATSLGFRNSVLLHERFFVAVEGPSEMAAFPILFKKHAGIPIQSAGICLWDGGNNEGALKFARFLKKHRRDVAFVVDKDSRINQKKTFRDDKLREYGFSLEDDCEYIGQPNELEDLFSNENWADAANSLWPQEGGELWTPEDFDQHRGSKFSSAILTMLKTGSTIGPKGKDVLMSGMASEIDKEDIPPDLTALFEKLTSRAQDAGPHYWDA